MKLRGDRMKKGMLVAGLVVSALLVTGCGEKTKNLSCTLKEDAGGVTTTSNMDVKFKGDKAESIVVDIVIDYEEKYASLADTFKKTLESQKSTLEDTGYDVEITSGKNSVKLTAKGTAETLTEDESTGTYEDTKKSLEDSGYTCK